jgi:hypothetical protein
VGVAWLAFLGASRERRAAPLDASDAAVAVGAAGALLFAAWGWLFGAGGRVLAWTPPETTWLLPAPVRRGALVNLKLLRVQVVVVANAIVWTLLVPAADAGASLRRAVGLWCLLSTLALHRIVAGLLRGQAMARGGAARMAGVTAGAVLYALGLLIASGTITAPDGATSWLTSPVAKAILWPFALLVAPVVKSAPDAWAAALPPALALLALHFALVHVAERVAEDSSTVQALAHLDAGGAGASGPHSRSVPLVRLGVQGPPALALTWKNVTMLLRRRLFAWLLGATVGAVLVVLLLERLSPVAATWLGSFALTWSAFLLLAGPQFLRNDLRGDLDHLEFLRVLPLRGRTMLGAELLAPVLLMSAALGVLVVLAHLGLRHSPEIAARFRSAEAAGGVLLATPGAATLVMLVQNAGAVLYPDWTRLTGRSGSAAALGTNLVGVLATAVAGGALAVPALQAATPLLLSTSPARPLLAGLVFSLVAVLEAVLLVGWLGGRLDRLEPLDRPPS